MLLEDQLADAKEAFKNAHEAGNKEAAQALAQRVFQLETQVSDLKKAEQESLESQSSYRNPAVAAGAGAVVGAATNPIRGAIHDIIANEPAPSAAPTTPINKVRTPYNPRGSSIEESVANWTNYADAQTEAARGVRRDTSLLKKYPNMQLGGIGSATAPTPEPPPLTTTQKGTNLLKGFVADHQPTRPMDIVKGGTRGAITGAALADVPQQLTQGNYGTAASDVGLAGGNILHGLARTPKGKAIGALLGLGSGIVRTGQGVNELMPTQQKAEGGLIHLASGGQPEFGEARAYEPSYSEKIRDFAARYMSPQQADVLFGGPRATMLDEFNPIGMTLRTPGAIADAAKGFYEAGKEGDYLGGMGHYLTGALNVAPAIKPGAQAVKTAAHELSPKAIKLINLLRNTNAVPGYAPGGTVLKKLHEVLTPHEGKTLLATLADRTKATGGFQGGPGFINLHPDYTWAVDAPAVAKKHMEAVERFGGPERTLMVPMLMSKEAHKSNRPVFEQIYGDVANRIKTGELTPEQIAAINQRIVANKGVDLTKNPGIENPDFLEFANAFNRRGALADILGLKKLGATNLQKHLDETIDPALTEAATGAIGPQLFTMRGYEHAPGLHSGYNIGFRGEKGVDQFTPAEREFVFRDLEKQAMEQMGRPMTDYNYRHVFKEHGGIPNQFIDEKLLRGLQEVGHKEGGLVAIKKKK